MSKLFDPGFLLISAVVFRKMCEDAVYHRFVMDSLERHVHGDWGVHDEYINGTNDLTQKDGLIHSAYEYRETVREPGVVLTGQRIERVTAIVITTSLKKPQTEVVSISELIHQ